MTSFGIEIEFVLQPKPHTIDILKARLDYAQEWEHKPGVPARRVYFLDDAERDEWNVKFDTSLVEPTRKTFGVELSSRVFSRHDQQHYWAEEINKVWGVIECYFDIVHSTSCGTHVHVGNVSSHAFDLRDVQSLAMGVFVFDSAWKGILDWSSTNNDKYAAPNSQLTSSPALRQASQGVNIDFPTVRNVIKSATSLPDLIRICNGGDRRAVWNFENLQVGGLGTIEFRMPPQARSAAEAIHWAAFAMVFVDFCRLNDWSRFAIDSRGIYGWAERSGSKEMLLNSRVVLFAVHCQ
ncbi:unnamed protein product [Zymoseptoria tritici ST99CH_3D1]|nr:unnamed protein product [Zymoseptoria tritici ST99CH_3D1]